MHHYMRCQISRKRCTLALAGGKQTVAWVRDAGRNAKKPLSKESFIRVQSRTKLETVHKLCKTLRTLASKNTPTSMSQLSCGLRIPLPNDLRYCKIYSILILSKSVVSIETAYGLDGPGIESRWGARFSAPVQTGPEADPASCTMGTGSFPGVSCGRGVTLTPHPLLVPRSKIEQSYTSTLPKGLHGL